MDSLYEIFGIEPSLNPNLRDLKSKYFALLKSHHPDLDNNTNNELFTSKINEAYKVLSNHWLRINYFFNLTQNIDLFSTKPSSTLLMEFMELNERVEETEFNKEDNEKLKHEIQKLIHNNNNALNSLIAHEHPNIEQITEIYQKHKYYSRIIENLEG